MATFGDFSGSYQRAASIGTGLRVEAGCWTQGGMDTTLYIPTTFHTCVAIVTNDADSSAVVASRPDVSSGYLKATLRNNGVNAILNYIAVGF